jgi:hypothetical protein
MVAGRGQVVKAQDITVTWREKELNSDRGTLRVEGSEAGTAIQSSRSSVSNTCQILEKVTSVSGTVRALAVKGIGDEFLAEIQDRLVELKRDIEWYTLQGTKTAESGTTPRQMGGVLNMVAAGNVVDLSADEGVTPGTLTENSVLDMLQAMWEAGALGTYYCFMNATEKRTFNALFKDSSAARLLLDASVNKFGIMCQTYDSDFGRIEIILNRWMPADTIFAVDLDYVEIAELRPAFYEDLAKTGDYFKGHVVVENTIKLLNSKAAGKIINIA